MHDPWGSREVRTEMLVASRWHEAFSARLHWDEAMHLKERPAMLSALKRRTRGAPRHGRRLLLLCDNMSVVLAASKGCCSSGPLLRLIRRCTAESLGSGIRMAVRWSPSEVDMANGPSRCWEQARRLAAPSSSGHVVSDTTNAEVEGYPALDEARDAPLPPGGAPRRVRPQDIALRSGAVDAGPRRGLSPTVEPADRSGAAPHPEAASRSETASRQWEDASGRLSGRWASWRQAR